MVGPFAVGAATTPSFPHRCRRLLPGTRSSSARFPARTKPSAVSRVKGGVSRIRTSSSVPSCTGKQCSRAASKGREPPSGSCSRPALACRVDTILLNRSFATGLRCGQRGEDHEAVLPRTPRLSGIFPHTNTASAAGPNLDIQNLAFSQTVNLDHNQAASRSRIAGCWRHPGRDSAGSTVTTSSAVGSAYYLATTANDPCRIPTETAAAPATAATYRGLGSFSTAASTSTARDHQPIGCVPRPRELPGLIESLERMSILGDMRVAGPFQYLQLPSHGFGHVAFHQG